MIDGTELKSLWSPSNVERVIGKSEKPRKLVILTGCLRGSKRSVLLWTSSKKLFFVFFKRKISQALLKAALFGKTTFYL